MSVPTPAQRASWKKRNPDKVKAYARKHRNKQKSGQYQRLWRYGLTEEKRQELLLRQNGLCAICFEDKPLVIVHDHATGDVRGLLCHSCNTGIGHLGDTAEGLQRALDYLA